MSEKTISRLVELAKAVRMTDGDREVQRRSFAFGNTATENARITRAMVDQQAEAMKA